MTTSFLSFNPEDTVNIRTDSQLQSNNKHPRKYSYCHAKWDPYSFSNYETTKPEEPTWAHRKEIIAQIKHPYNVLKYSEAFQNLSKVLLKINILGVTTESFVDKFGPRHSGIRIYVYRYTYIYEIYLSLKPTTVGFCFLNLQEFGSLLHALN